jgi:transaldolase
MAKAIIRDDVAPAIIYDENTANYVSVFAGRVFDADDPFVAEHRDLFDRGVEQATAAPGEKRTRRAA